MVANMKAKCVKSIKTEPQYGSLTAKENICGLMGPSMLETGTEARCKASESTLDLRRIHTRANSKLILQMARAKYPLLMDPLMRASGRINYTTAKENKYSKPKH